MAKRAFSPLLKHGIRCKLICGTAPIPTAVPCVGIEMENKKRIDCVLPKTICSPIMKVSKRADGANDRSGYGSDLGQISVYEAYKDRRCCENLWATRWAKGDKAVGL